MIAVGTPSRPDGSADTGYVERGRHGRWRRRCRMAGCTVVVKSTVPIGPTGRWNM